MIRSKSKKVEVNTLVTADDLRSALRSNDTRYVVKQLYVFLLDITKRRHLMTSIFYPCLTDILGTIFGFDNSQLSWFLSPEIDYKSLCAILAPPNGPLYKAIFSLAQFPPRYEVPFTRLPNVSRRKLETNDLKGLSPLYNDHSKSKLTRSNVVEFDIEEYFFYLFLYYPLHSCSQREYQYNNNNSSLYMSSFTRLRSSQSSNKPKTVIENNADYLDILLEYLEHFFPIKRKKYNGNNNNNSNTLHNNNNNNSNYSYNNMNYRNEMHNSNSNNNNNNNNSSGVSKHGRTFLLLIAEFWLNQNEAPTNAMLTAQNTPTRQRHQRYIYDYNIPPALVLEGIKLLLKHFTQVAIERNITMCEEIEIIQKPLFLFLRAGFCRISSPFATSELKRLVHIWLHYIQPWKQYNRIMSNTPSSHNNNNSNHNNMSNNNNNRNSKSDILSGTVPATPTTLLRSFFGDSPNKESNDNSNNRRERFKDKKRLYNKNWKNFIMQNCAFYTVLTSDIIKLIHDFDYCVPSNMKLLSKIIEVFDDKLLKILLLCEETLINSTYTHYDIPSSIHTSSSSSNNNFNSKNDLSLTSDEVFILRNSFLQLCEIPVSMFTPVFWRPSKNHSTIRSPGGRNWAVTNNTNDYSYRVDESLFRGLRELQRSLCQARNYALQINKSTKRNKTSAFSFETQKESYKSAPNDVSARLCEKILKKVEKLFVLDPFDDIGMVSPKVRVRDNGDSLLPEYERLGDNIIQLTTKGRRLIKEGKRICSIMEMDIPFVGDIWDRPKTNREISIVLSIMHNVSELLNSRLIGKCNVVECDSLAAMGRINTDDEFGKRGLRCYYHDGYKNPVKYRINLRALADRMNLFYSTILIFIILSIVTHMFIPSNND